MSKKYNDVLKKVNNEKGYSIKEAVKFLKDNSFVNFDASVEIGINLGLDVTKAEQQIRTMLSLPNGTGKKTDILVIASGEEFKVAKKLDVKHVLDEEAIDKINSGWLDFDAIITTPEMMPKLGKVAKILGPKGLMPNPKLGSVTKDIKKAVEDINKGQIELRTDKEANINNIAGKISFDAKKLEENITSILEEVKKLKPNSAKGDYIKTFTISSSMMPGLRINFE